MGVPDQHVTMTTVIGQGGGVNDNTGYIMNLQGWAAWCMLRHMHQIRSDVAMLWREVLFVIPMLHPSHLHNTSSERKF